MTVRRVHLPPGRIEGATARLTPEARHYLRDVLRLSPGDEVELFDGAGGAFPARIDPGFEALALGPRREARTAGVPLWLLFALSRGEKADLVVQKATELGVARLVPWIADRSVVRLEGARAEERARRWRRIAEEAARQCRRDDVPEVRPPGSLAAALGGVPAGFGRVVLHGEGGGALGTLGPSPSGGYALLVGPEGGLTGAELAACEAAGFTRLGLGPRTLRAETAAIVGVALLQARFGDLSGSVP
ncbi:MAG TPA: 16S rRNA (uracil(1498)-N(3))-methyltransferase [Anaeromyxobacteraceae bacterium]|nr:16S rRNA (uracil(1498)-N(3))-methyltransferase [Anaeromyxobacteraceae bacterium]